MSFFQVSFFQVKKVSSEIPYLRKKSKKTKGKKI
jgi:hypothetical protein